MEKAVAYLKLTWLRIQKSWKSWVIWFNGLFGSFIILLPSLQAELPNLQAYLPDHLYHWVAGILVVGNILLRLKTTKDLADK